MRHLPTKTRSTSALPPPTKCEGARAQLRCADPGWAPKSKRNDFTRPFLVFAAGAALLCGGGVRAAEPDTPAFHPGEIWRDDQDHVINAHGGGFLWHEGVYYWFGEHKIEGGAG